MIDHDKELTLLAEAMERLKMMDLKEAMKERHSVRQYTDQPLETGVVSALEDEIRACNSEGRLHIQLVRNEPKAFDSFIAHYGKFSGITDYAGKENFQWE